ncbi:MAG: MFS transporter [Patescibacteria group bacterium]
MMPRERSKRSSLFLGYVYMFLFSFRFSDAFWVIYLRSRGLSFAMVGVLETVFHLSSLLGEVPTGWIADHFGRKTSLVCGRALAVLSATMALLARSPAGFALAFALGALGYTCHSGAYDAYLFDELKEAGNEGAFTRVMGAVNAVYLAGCSAAALCGGFVAARALPLLYVCNIGVDLLAILLLLPLHERPHAGRAERRRLDLGRDLRELLAILRNRSLAGLMLLQAAAGTLVTSFYFYSQGYMREKLIPLTAIGAAGMLGNLAAVVPTWFSHRLEKRFGDRIPLYLGSALVPLIILAAGLLPSGPGIAWRGALIALIVAVNVVFEVLYPLFAGAVNALVPSERRATVLSSGGMLFSLMMMAVFPFIGWCGDRIGLAGAFVLTGGAALALGGAAAVVLRGRHE